MHSRLTLILLFMIDGIAACRDSTTKTARAAETADAEVVSDDVDAARAAPADGTVRWQRGRNDVVDARSCEADGDCGSGERCRVLSVDASPVVGVVYAADVADRFAAAREQRTP